MSDDSPRHESDGSFDVIGRRDYLKATAAAAVAGAAASGTASAAPQVDASVSGSYTFDDNGDHYEYVVDSGGHIQFVIQDGGTVQNLLIDITASGASASILSQTGWDDIPPASYTLRNIGVEGAQSGDSPLFVTSCTDEALIEHVYAGDGTVNYPVSSNWNDYPGCWRASLEHSGHLVMREIYASKWIDNALYMSPPADPGNGNGTFHLEDCYVVDNQISCYRFGTDTTMENCYGATQPGDHRVFWGYDNSNVSSYDVDIYGSSLDAANADRAIEHNAESNFVLASDVEYTGENGTGTVTGGTQTSDPTEFVPAGVPTSALEAATGDSGGGGGGGGGGVEVEPTVIEDFERSDPLADYGGATSLFGVETSTVYEGSQALVNDGGSFGSVASTSGLDDYPERGDRIDFHFTNAGDDNFVAAHLFAQSETDNPDSYSIGISSAGAWRMWRHDGGDVTQIAGQDLPSSDQIDGWYRAEVWSDASTVYADLYDDANDTLLASISADDTTYSSGGIGFRSAGNGEVWDYAVRDVLEDFERSSPLDEYGGADGLFGVETSTVYEGSQALINDGGDFGSAVSTAGLSTYPERGDEVHYHFTNAGDDNFVAVHLFAQSETDNPDGYTVGISAAGAWRMWKNQNGNIDTIASQDLPTSDQISGWYRAEISSDASTVYADLYDDADDTLLASIQADDTDYTSGGIGFRSAGNGEVWDYVRR